MQCFYFDGPGWMMMMMILLFSLCRLLAFQAQVSLCFLCLCACEKHLAIVSFWDSGIEWATEKRMHRTGETIVGVFIRFQLNMCKCIRVDNNNGTMPTEKRILCGIVANIVIVVIFIWNFAFYSTKFHTYFFSLHFSLARSLSLFLFSFSLCCYFFV